MSTVDEMTAAALGWLDTLTAEQRATAVGSMPGPDPVTDAERRRWFYTPTDHGGLTLHEQRPAQQRAAMRLVASGLSRAGFVTVATVMGLENVLDHTEGFQVLFDRERGRDPGLYYLRVFGEPGGAGPWGWRFGGHHVSLHNLVVDGRIVATTPCFLGADPASAPLLGGVLRPLAGPEDLARALVRSLRPALAADALLAPRAPTDIVGANRTALAEVVAPGSGCSMMPQRSAAAAIGRWLAGRSEGDRRQMLIQAVSPCRATVSCGRACGSPVTVAVISRSAIRPAGPVTTDMSHSSHARRTNRAAPSRAAAGSPGSGIRRVTRSGRVSRAAQAAVRSGQTGTVHPIPDPVSTAPIAGVAAHSSSRAAGQPPALAWTPANTAIDGAHPSSSPDSSTSAQPSWARAPRSTARTAGAVVTANVPTRCTTLNPPQRRTVARMSGRSIGSRDG